MPKGRKNHTVTLTNACAARRTPPSALPALPAIRRRPPSEPRRPARNRQSIPTRRSARAKRAACTSAPGRVTIDRPCPRRGRVRKDLPEVFPANHPFSPSSSACKCSTRRRMRSRAWLSTNSFSSCVCCWSPIRETNWLTFRPSASCISRSLPRGETR